MRKWFNVRNLMVYVLWTFLISIVFVVARIVNAPTIAPISDITFRVKSDYVLMLLQSIIGILALLLPLFLRRRANLSIPDFMLIAYALFLYCAIYLGEVRSFYYNVPHWDTILHAFSGAALGALGFSLVSLLNDTESVAFSLSPFFVALFAFCFAVSLGVLWEIYEFSMDYFLKTDMQKYMLENGEPLIGQAALMDTMKDLIVDAAGAFVMSAAGYVSLKHGKGWLERFQLRKMDEQPG